MLDEVDQLEDPSGIYDLQYRWRELLNTRPYRFVV